MALPSRLNLVDIVLRQIKKSSADSPIDPDFGEPKLVVNYNSPVTVQGQANFGTRMWNAMLATLTGTENRSRGHLVFRKTDLASAGITLQTGDRVTSIAGEACELQIREVRFESPLNGVFLLVYAMLENSREVSVSN